MWSPSRQSTAAAPANHPPWACISSLAAAGVLFYPGPMQRAVWKSTATIYGLAAVVGVGAGVAAVLFEYLSGLVVWLVLERGVGYWPSGPDGELRHFGTIVPGEIWVLGLLLAPALGGFISSALCRWLAPEASGHGTDAVIDAYHNREGVIRGRVPIVKAFATAISLGTGGSGGREGPIAQIGAGLGATLGRYLHLRPRQRRILLAAGMGAGVGSIFRAPLAGALFSAEILYRDAELESEAVIPSFISSAVAYCVLCGWMGDFGRLFGQTSGFVFNDPTELFSYTLLALVLVPMVLAYSKVFYGAERLFAAIPGPRPLVAALGGLLTGGIAIVVWKLTADDDALAILSYGYGIIQHALDGSIVGWDGVRLLVLVAVFKIVSTSMTISSGGSGGVFGPSMVIGGGLGGAVGLACHQLGWVSNPGCFVIVGMSGFFAGAANTPISTIIMVSEMTGSYELLLPAMWVCGITFILTSGKSIYTSQVNNRGSSLAHRGEYQVALLEKMRVADVFEREQFHRVVAPETPLAEVVKIIADCEDDYFPVVDTEQRFVGIFSAHDVRAYTYDDSIHRLAIAADLMTTSPIVLTPDDDLHTALEKFNIKKLDELPVVDNDDPSRLLGILRRRAIGRAYSQKLGELHALQARNS